MNDQVHVAVNGKEFGVFSHQQIEAMLESGEIAYGNSLAWKQGQSEWRPLRELFPPKASLMPLTEMPPLPQDVSRAIPQTDVPTLFADYCLPRGRVGRNTYIVRHLLYTGGYYFLASLISIGSNKPPLIPFLVISCVYVYLSIINGVKRLHDFNTTGWTSLVYLVPGINIVAAVYMLAVSGTKGSNRFGSEPPIYGTGF